ncbi:carbohydrate ABC transporter permease [Cohnella soli]|uniref:Carbohydrate ABC transporter permease n=1 Tax=Cohnella soli TaxID=425005 RepID=A0ABW0I2H3_9BACL
MKPDPKRNLFSVIGYSYVSILSIVCFVPFWLIISGSFSSESSIVKKGYSIIPGQFSFKAYETLFRYSDRIVSAYTVTVALTVLGTFLGLFLMAMAAFVLLRQDFKYRNYFAFFFYFTLLFSGGLVPFYLLMVGYLELKNTFLSMLLPSMMSAWNLLLLRNFMKNVPESIIESAKIDGAGDFTIFMRFIVPLSKSGLATIGLFVALVYWNDWFNAMLFIDDMNLYPLQYLLYKTIQQVEGLQMASQKGAAVSLAELPAESIKMATAVISTGPILLVFPFIQKYFVKGIVVGSVKG